MGEKIWNHNSTQLFQTPEFREKNPSYFLIKGLNNRKD